jgi:hypothetical protein
LASFPERTKFIARPRGMFGVNDEPADGMQQSGVVASFGKRLAGLGVKPDEPARLMHRLAQKLKIGFPNGARVAQNPRLIRS